MDFTNVRLDQESKLYIRICPECNEEITSKNRSYALKAARSLTLCSKCMKSKTNEERIKLREDHPNVYEIEEGWAKKCPVCNEEQTYVRRIIAIQAAKAGSICLPCSNKRVGKNKFMGWHRGIRVSWFNKFKSMSKNRKTAREWKITLDDVADIWESQNHHCALSGMPLEFKTTPGKHYTSGQPSLDRIDSNGDYTKDNIQIVDSRVNVMKNKLSQDEFIGICKLISSNFIDFEYSVKPQTEISYWRH